jgi:gas vesicle protein
MAEDNNVSSINSVAWFIAGLGVGALVGILYAPKSGRETREDLVNSAKEGADYARERGRQAADYANDLYGKSKDYAAGYADRGREYYERGREQWGDFVERGKNLVNEQSTRVTAAVQAGREAYKSHPAETTEPVAEGQS